MKTSAEAVEQRAAAHGRMRESVLVKGCIQYLQLRGCFVWRQNQGSVTAEHKGKVRHFRFAGADGISDVIGMLRSGRFLAVECKIHPNKPTPEQSAFLERVRIHGGVALVVYTIDELIAALKEHGA